MRELVKFAVIELDMLKVGKQNLWATVGGSIFLLGLYALIYDISFDFFSWTFFIQLILFFRTLYGAHCTARSLSSYWLYVVRSRTTFIATLWSQFKNGCRLRYDDRAVTKHRYAQSFAVAILGDRRRACATRLLF